MALAHHDAAGGDQRRGGEAELVGAEQRADDDVAAGAQAAVDLHGDARAQPVQHQRLLRLGEPDLPRAAGMLDRGQRRGAGAALEAGDRDVVGARLGDAGRDRADADLGDELHRDVGGRVDVLQIEDELRQILDRIDVVMRRRRDQADARRRVAHLGDDRVDLVAGQLAAFAGLCALRHLDLHHVGVDEIFGRHAEAARGDLLDRRAHRIAVRQRLVAIRLLAALAGVRLAADAVHGDGERGVRLARDRAERHRAGGEALDDLLGRLDLVERHRLRGRPPRPILMRNRPRMVRKRSACSFTICAKARYLSRALPRTACCSVGDRSPATRHAPRRACGTGIRRRPRARCAAPATSPKASRWRRTVSSAISSRPTPSIVVAVPVKYLSTKSLRQADRVEDLRAAIGLVGRDAHLGHHLEDALVDRLDVALDDLVVVDLLRELAPSWRPASRRRDRG